MLLPILLDDADHLGAGNWFGHVAEHLNAVLTDHLFHCMNQRGIHGTGNSSGICQIPLGQVSKELDAIHARHIQITQYDMNTAGMVNNLFKSSVALWC